MRKTDLTINEVRNWLEQNGWKKGNQENEIIYYKGTAYVILREDANTISYTDLSTGFSTFSAIKKLSIEGSGTLEFRTNSYIMSNAEIEFLKHFHEEQK